MAIVSEDADLNVLLVPEPDPLAGYLSLMWAHRRLGVVVVDPRPTETDWPGPAGSPCRRVTRAPLGSSTWRTPSGRRPIRRDLFELGGNSM